MDWGNYLFGFEGRINRAKIWLFFLIIIAAYIAFGIVFTVAFGTSFFAMLVMTATRPAALFEGGALLSAVIFCAFYVFVFYVGLAVSAKRLHDRNKDAIWLLPFIILPAAINLASAAIAPRDFSAGPMPVNPIMMILQLVSLALSIWAFVELYCLRGTEGDNRFGPDPLGGKA